MHNAISGRCHVIVGALGLSFLIAGCAGRTWINKQYSQPVGAGGERVLLMPVVAHRFHKTTLAPVQALLQAEVSRAFSGAAVDLASFRAKLWPAGFGNLSWKIALGLYQRGKQNHSPDIRGEYYEWLDDLPGETLRFLAWIKGARPGTNGARYLLSFYVDRIARKDRPKKGVVITFRVMGGLFDAQRGRIVAATSFDYTCPPKLDRIKAALDGVGARLRDALRPVLP